MSFLREFWGYLRARRKFWLLPLMVVLVLLGLLLVVGGSTLVGPFIYTLF